MHNILTVLNKSILKTLQIGKWELISMYVLSLHNHCVCLYTKAIHMIIGIQYISWVHVYTIIVYSNLHIHSWFWSCRYRDWQGIYSGTYIHTSLIYMYVYIVPRVKQKGLMTKQYLYLSISSTLHLNLPGENRPVDYSALSINAFLKLEEFQISQKI